MTVSLTARTAGRVTVNIYNEKLLATVSQDVRPGTATLRLPVGSDWGSGAYAVATLRRPLDAPAQRMPGRAIGVQWFAIDRAAKTLALDLQLPQTIRPNGKLTIPVKVGGLAAGEEARVVVAAVDVGILNLTNYKPPAPDDYYLGQRRLGAEVRDLYGQLIDGMQGSGRAHPLRWRWRRRRTVRLAAGTGAARSLFRHCHGQSRRHRAGRVRYSGFCRHGARHGDRVEQDAARQGDRRRGHSRSGRAHDDAAAFPAHR